MKSANSMLNLETITYDAYAALNALDKTLVGTDDYIGVAYFWAWDYRYYLRDVSYAKRRQIHRTLLKTGLSVDSVSEAHESIIKDIVSRKRKTRQTTPY